MASVVSCWQSSIPLTTDWVFNVALVGLWCNSEVYIHKYRKGHKKHPSDYAFYTARVHMFSCTSNTVFQSSFLSTQDETKTLKPNVKILNRNITI